MSAAAKVFLEVAATVDDVPFGMASESEVFSEHKVDGDHVVLFKKVRLSCGLDLLAETCKTAHRLLTRFTRVVLRTYDNAFEASTSNYLHTITTGSVCFITFSSCVTTQFDEGRNDLKAGDDLTAEAIKSFITGNQLPLVIEFTQEVRRPPPAPRAVLPIQEHSTVCSSGILRGTSLSLVDWNVAFNAQLCWGGGGSGSSPWGVHCREKVGK